MQFAQSTDTIDLGDDKMVEILALKPFGESWKKQNILQVYESFSTKRLAFDMGTCYFDSNRCHL